MQWHEKQIEISKMHWSKNVRQYVRQHEINAENRSTDYIQRWLIGLSVVKKREANTNGNRNDIRQYMM